MAKILRFPIHQVEQRGLFCPPLKIHFPALYRTVQTVTQAWIEAEKATNLEPLDGVVGYTLNPDLEYTGSVERTLVNRIVDHDYDSLVIRHHRDMDAALAYLRGIADVAGLCESADPVRGTESGLFTLVQRRTGKSWPGPMVFYVAEYFTDAVSGIDEWQMATAPDGTTAVSEYL